MAEALDRHHVQVETSGAEWIQVDPALVQILEEQAQVQEILKRQCDGVVQFNRVELVTICRQRKALRKWHQEAVHEAPSGLGPQSGTYPAYQRFRRILPTTKEPAQQMKGPQGPLRTIDWSTRVPARPRLH